MTETDKPGRLVLTSDRPVSVQGVKNRVHFGVDGDHGMKTTSSREPIVLDETGSKCLAAGGRHNYVHPNASNDKHETIAKLSNMIAPFRTRAVPESPDSTLDATYHYQLNTGPVHQFPGSSQTKAAIKNVGWTLGNACPYRCTHCYSMSARVKGRDLTKLMVQRVVDQLRANGIETVNLGGNEPLFTNGLNPHHSLLPEIIGQLVAAGMEVGLTTSGISLLHLHKSHRWAFNLLNDVDVSIDSPYESEHNSNRGARLYSQAVEALGVCRKHNKPHTIIMAGMKWNFTIDRLEALVALAREYAAAVRINPVKPVEKAHMSFALPAQMYYAGFSYLFEACESIDLGEPPLAALSGFQNARRCPCGRSSFRIHSISPDGHIYVSPCVYLHDFKVPLDLLHFDLADIIESPQFQVFRRRNAHPEEIEGCNGCELLDQCGGGCAARSYLHNWHETGVRSMSVRDPYCPIEVFAGEFPRVERLRWIGRLVHMDYLCTWIGIPR